MPRSLQEMKKKKSKIVKESAYSRLAIHLCSLLLGLSVDTERDS